MLRLSGLEDEGPFEPVDKDTCQIAHKDNPCNFLQIPTEGNLLQTHYHNASGRTDDEHRATDTGAVGQQLPEDTVHGQVTSGLNGIHTHAARHEGYIVDNAGEYTNDTGYEVVVTLEGGIKSLA